MTVASLPSPVASQRVADIVAMRILSGDLPPGVRIKQDELARELATSRIPVRDALRILEARGLVTMRANAGARVISLNRRELEVSYEIRERIEPLLLAESVPHLTDADLADLRLVLARSEGVTDADEAIALDREFLTIAYRRHSTPLLAQLVERLWDTTQSYRRAVEELAMAHEESSYINQLPLYEAIARREIPTAQSALILQIRQAAAHLIRYGRSISGGKKRRTA